VVDALGAGRVLFSGGSSFFRRDSVVAGSANSTLDFGGITLIDGTITTTGQISVSGNVKFGAGIDLSAILSGSAGIFVQGGRLEIAANDLNFPPITLSNPGVLDVSGNNLGVERLTVLGGSGSMLGTLSTDELRISGSTATFAAIGDLTTRVLRVELGTLTGSGRVNVTETFVLSGGTVSGAGGSLSVDAGAQATQNATMVINGTASWETRSLLVAASTAASWLSGDVTISRRATWTIDGSLSVSASAARSLTDGTTSEQRSRIVVTASGRLTKEAPGTSDVTLNAVVLNAGLVATRSGRIVFNYGAESAGANAMWRAHTTSDFLKLAASGSATYRLLLGSVEGNGTLEVVGGVTFVNASFSPRTTTVSSSGTLTFLSGTNFTSVNRSLDVLRVSASTVRFFCDSSNVPNLEMQSNGRVDTGFANLTFDSITFSGSRNSRVPEVISSGLVTTRVMSMAGGQLAGPGRVVVLGSFDWTYGFMTGFGVTEIARGGTMTVSGTFHTGNDCCTTYYYHLYKNIETRTLLNYGTVIHNTGFIRMYTSAVVINMDGAEFRLASTGTSHQRVTSDGSPYQGYADAYQLNAADNNPRPRFLNFGNITRPTGSAVAFELQTLVENYGDIRVTGGVLRFQRGGLSGVVSSATAGVLGSYAQLPRGYIGANDVRVGRIIAEGTRAFEVEAWPYELALGSQVFGNGVVATRNSGTINLDTVSNLTGTFDVGSGTLNVLQSAELQVGGSAQVLVTGGSLNAVKTSLTLPTTAVSAGTLNAASSTARVGQLTVSGSGNVRTDRELRCDQLLLQGGFVTTSSVFILTGAANSSFTGGEVRRPGTRGRFEVNGVLAVSSATVKTLRDCAVVLKPGATMQWMSATCRCTCRLSCAWRLARCWLSTPPRPLR
jgi:hypothetical protein